MKKQTTIRVDKETRDMLDSFKVHPRQSYDEVLNNLIKMVETNKNG